MSISANQFNQENADSDSESNSDDSPDYYQPISATPDDDDNDEDENPDHVFNSPSSETPNFQPFPNGHIGGGRAENGIESLNLNDDDDEEEETEAEEEERVREAISRAFREDENRRTAPLTPENSNRIMDAMRGISLQGFAPNWTSQVPDDRWIDQLRRLREPPSTTSTTSTSHN